MRDLAGFALLLLILMLSAYVLFQFVFPFLTKYLLGLILYFLVATVLVWKGRLHPIHLDSLLRPGYTMTLAMLSVSIPLAHSMLVFLLTDVEHWLVVFAINVTIPLVWTSRMLVVHRRQKNIYHSEGHDIEDLLETAQCRDAALEVKIDVLDSLKNLSSEPEPWEQAVALESVSYREDSESLNQAQGEIMDLRNSYATVVRDLVLALNEARSGTLAPPHPALERSRKVLDELEAGFSDVMGRTESILSEVNSGMGTPGWED